MNNNQYMSWAATTIYMFSNFMHDHYIREDSPAGRLARIMQADIDSFPGNYLNNLPEERKKIEKYLIDNHASKEQIKVFNECFTEYEKEIERLYSGDKIL